MDRSSLVWSRAINLTFHVHSGAWQPGQGSGREDLQVLCLELDWKLAVQEGRRHKEQMYAYEWKGRLLGICTPHEITPQACVQPRNTKNHEPREQKEPRLPQASSVGSRDVCPGGPSLQFRGMISEGCKKPDLFPFFFLS